MYSARRLARVKARDDEARAARIEQRHGEALLTAGVLKRVEANDADALQRDSRATFDAGQSAAHVLHAQRQLVEPLPSRSTLSWRSAGISGRKRRQARQAVVRSTSQIASSSASSADDERGNGNIGGGLGGQAELPLEAAEVAAILCPAARPAAAKLAPR